MPRKKKNRNLRTRFAVLGDGQTEQYYLSHLKSIKGYKYSVYPSLFSDITIERAESKIDELLSGGCDMIVYFTDYDTIVNQNKIAKFNELKRKYRQHLEVLICETMPCIEFWFLLHYRKTTREFANAGEVIQQLKQHIEAYGKGKAFLGNSTWVEELCADERLETAIRNAAEILQQMDKQPVGQHFPFTKAHLGIQRFEELKNG